MRPAPPGFAATSGRLPRAVRQRAPTIAVSGQARHTGVHEPEEHALEPQEGTDTGVDGDAPGRLRMAVAATPAARAASTGGGARPGRRRDLLVVGAVVGALVLVAILVVARPPRPLAVQDDLPTLPAAPPGPVAQRWVRPVERPVHDVVVVDDLVLLVEFAPVSQGLPAGVHVTALDVVDGVRRWERRVPARSLVAVVDDGRVRALLDVATALGPALTVRALSLESGREAWVRPTDDARRIVWGPPDLVVTTGESCRARRAATGTEVVGGPAVVDACGRADRTARVVTVEVGGDAWVLDAAPGRASGGAAVGGLEVRSSDDQPVAAHAGGDMVLDDLDDRLLGGQLTTRGMVVASADGRRVALLAVPSLVEAWTVDLPDPVTRLASGGRAVAVVTARGDGRFDLRVLR